MSSKRFDPTRRDVLLGAGAALGAQSLGSPGALRRLPPSEKVTVGMIGMGGHGIGWNLPGFLRCEDVRVVAVCDVMAARGEDARRRVDEAYGDSSCTTHADWRDLIARDDIDAVMISTPDHWHVPMSMAAIRAGKDVCCEKPTLTIEEGRVLSNAVRESGAIFQTSTEDRSIPVYHRMAELVRNGRIGRLERIRITLPEATVKPAPPDLAAVPEGFDYDMWLGPAPAAPYAHNRCGNQQWRNISDYSGGKFSDWGMHQVDTAQWANDTEGTGPIWVEGSGEFPGKDSLFDTAIRYQLRYGYANGVELQIQSGGTSLRFEGTEGWVGNSGWRQPLEASSPEILASKIGPEETHLYTCRGGEHRNFIDCVRSREAPYFPAEVGHRCATVLHMGNISMGLGRKLSWDPAGEAFVSDAEANALRSRPLREPWTL